MSCVIVLGCYRSGTSCVAGILQRLGVSMGDKFDPPTSSNPSGFYEDLEFKRLFDMMSDGKQVDGLLEVLIKTREIEKPLWGVKDPQLCLFLPRFISLFKNHKLISTVRPKEEICDSLSRAMKNKGVDKSFSNIVDYYLAKKAEALSAYGDSYLEIEWNRMKSNPKEEVEKIAEFISLPFDQKAVDFVRVSQ